MKQSGAISSEIRVHHLGEQQGFFHYLLRLPTYPLAGDEREQHVARLIELVDALQAQYGGSQEILLQMWKLNHDHASKEVSKNGVAWIPLVGVGVWPHKSPPAV